MSNSRPTNGVEKTRPSPTVPSPVEIRTGTLRSTNEIVWKPVDASPLAKRAGKKDVLILGVETRQSPGKPGNVTPDTRHTRQSGSVIESTLSRASFRP